MDWWNVLVFALIPILSVLIMFIVKRKLLWVSPLFSFALAILVSGLGMGFDSFFKNHYQLLWLAMFVNLFISAILTGVLFFLSKLLVRRK